MNADWPKDPVIEDAVAAWGARCDDALAPPDETPAVVAIDRSDETPAVVAIDRPARGRRLGHRPWPAAVAGLCALVLVVIAAGVVVTRPDPVRDVAVGTGGQVTGSTTGPAPTVAASPSISPSTSPSTSAPPAGQPFVHQEKAAVSAPAGVASGPSPDPCGAPPLLTVYSLPGDGRPAGVAPGDNGSVWFTDQATRAIGRIEVNGGVTRYSLPPNVYAHSIARSPTGDMWFTNPGPQEPNSSPTPSIGRLTPAGQLSLYPLPTAAQNPLGGPGLGSGPTAIAAGPDGAMWFTETGADQIGRITADGRITEYPLPSRTSMHANPSDIVAGPDGAMWFTQPLAESIGRIDVATYAITEVLLPKAGSGVVRANSLASGPAGSLWFEDPRNFTLGRITPAGAVTSVAIPDTARPADVTAGPDGNLWFIDGRGRRIMRVTPAGAVTEFPAVDGLRWSSVSQLAVASDRAVWFAVGGANRLGRIACGP